MVDNINNLSSKIDWENHWEKFIPFTIKYIRIDDLIADLPKNADFIEIGGFPGIYSIYFQKKLGYKSTLLDFVINKDIINKLERKNDVPENSIEVIESDFFNFETHKKYDVVFSWGFIEHFNDIPDVLSRHYKILQDGGHLLIGMPNLKGLSGWFNKISDKNCYAIHNLNCMNIEYLNEICQKFNLKEINIFYYGNPKIWINSSSKYYNKFVVSLVWLLNMILKRINLKNKYFSPHIIIKAVK
jgi:SAM-dependent methyltransferase